MSGVVLAGSMLLHLSNASAGGVVGGTRLIYNTNKSEASLTLSNQEKKGAYLIQSWLENGDENTTQPIPLVITPPLFRMDGGQENILRIVYTGSPALPKNRESLFWLNTKSIPETSKTENNRLLISVRSRIKLFYRPKGLPGNANEAYKSLTWQRQGTRLTVTNPTPYYVSFNKVSVGTTEVKNPPMVTPFGSASMETPTTSGAIT
ncbi:molecular chaperone [Serratia liquefaciens]|nr:molecular chaperone [Serratia liquefaciens]